MHGRESAEPSLDCGPPLVCSPACDSEQSLFSGRALACGVTTTVNQPGDSGCLSPADVTSPGKCTDLIARGYLNSGYKLYLDLGKENKENLP